MDVSSIGEGQFRGSGFRVRSVKIEWFGDHQLFQPQKTRNKFISGLDMKKGNYLRMNFIRITNLNWDEFERRFYEL
ncbi:MAG: hypothetical protein H0M93_01025 [Methanophagales archaeon]|nr:hypothetical protein [Methanophagales archaeon]